MSSNIKKHNLFLILITGILLLSLFIRVYDISARLFHADEGVNYHFLKEMESKGYYPYSHENYHGPLFFYLTKGMVDLLGGYNDFAMRSSAILMGWLTIVSILLLLKTESKKFIIYALIFAGFSTSLVFKSRYIIHESLFLFSGVILAWGVYLWFKTRKSIYHYFSGVGLGMIISTKETFIITLFCIFFSFIALGDWKNVVKDLKLQWPSIFNALLIAIIIVIFSFTGGLQWAAGLREMFYAVPQWIGRNESDYGHFKPFGYYIYIVLGPYLGQLVEQYLGINTTSWRSVEATESQLWYLIAVFIFSLFVFPWRWRRWISSEYAIGRFLFVWTLLAFLVYGFVSYKTPWLIINMTLPAGLLLAFCLSKLPGILGITVSLLLSTLAIFNAYTYNLKYPLGKKNPLAYVHTHPGMLDFVNDLKKYRSNKEKARVLVGTSQYWPLPYYLRNHPEGSGYEKATEVNKYVNNYDVIVVDPEIKWDDPNWIYQYYRLTEVQEANIYYRK
jgi:uncharacterized protein (TIGR03663 family)